MLMHRILLVGCCVVWAATAHAQGVITLPGQGTLDPAANAAGTGGLPVGGLGIGLPVACTNCTTEITTLADAAAVAANWVTQLERMTAQINEQILIFQQLSGLTHVNDMAAVLNGAAIFNQMNSFGNVAALLQGAGGGVGAGYQAANATLMPIGSVIPLMNATNTIFNNRANSLASIQGISAQLLVNSNVILTGLMALQHLIDAQPSSQLMGGMNARLASYQGNINSQQYQLSQMRAFANAQDKVFEQQVQQAGYCADLDMVNATKSLTGAGPEVGAAHCGAPAAGGVPVAAAAPAADGGGAIDTAGFDTPVAPAPAPIVVAGG